MGAFEELSVCRWQAAGKRAVAFPVKRISEVFKNRLVVRRRPYRPGAKLNNTGPDPIGFDLECELYNGHEEPDLEDGDNIYPALVNALLDSFTARETGTLFLPTRGPVRCMLDNYRRVETDAARDTAFVTLSFLRDSEDDISAASFATPAARSIARRLAEQAQNDAEAAGAWSADLADLAELASGLEALANAPGEFVDNAFAQANAVASMCERVERAFSGAAGSSSSEVTRLLAHPESSRTVRTLRRLANAAASAAPAGASGRIVTKRFASTVSIFDVATSLGQDPNKLMLLNRALENFFSILPGTPIRVFAEAS